MGREARVEREVFKNGLRRPPKPSNLWSAEELRTIMRLWAGIDKVPTQPEKPSIPGVEVLSYDPDLVEPSVTGD